MCSSKVRKALKSRLPWFYYLLNNNSFHIFIIYTVINVFKKQYIFLYLVIVYDDLEDASVNSKSCYFVEVRRIYKLSIEFVLFKYVYYK